MEGTNTSSTFFKSDKIDSMIVFLQAMESVMPAKKYIVRLSGEEYEQLEGLVKKGKAVAHKRLHAQILLTADVDEGRPGWKDEPISQGLGSVRARWSGCASA